MENQYKEEIQLGNAAKHAYDNFIGSFIQSKREVLFEAFKAISVTETDALIECKRQLMVIDTLDDEIKTIIETGRLAAISLNENKE